MKIFKCWSNVKIIKAVKYWKFNVSSVGENFCYIERGIFFFFFEKYITKYVIKFHKRLKANFECFKIFFPTHTFSICLNKNLKTVEPILVKLCKNFHNNPLKLANLINLKSSFFLNKWIKIKFITTFELIIKLEKFFF